jgi:hypothetical protein
MVKVLVFRNSLLKYKVGTLRNNVREEHLNFFCVEDIHDLLDV